MDDLPPGTTLPPDHWFRERRREWESRMSALGQRVYDAELRADKAEEALRNCRRELDKVRLDLMVAQLILLRSIMAGKKI